MFNSKQIEKNTKIYTNRHEAFRALLGGIGTGNISLDNTGAFNDFEVLNHPDKGLKIPYTFFSLYYAEKNGENKKCCILETEPREKYCKALGYPSGYLYGLPIMESCKIKTKYPFFVYEFEKEELPLEVKLQAYTPFIPLDSQNSGMPVAQMKYSVTNRSDQTVNVSVCGTMYNFTGFTSYDGYDRLYQDGIPVNSFIENDGLSGLYFESSEIDKKSVNYGNLALFSSNENITVKPYWQDGGWWDGAEEFWQNFSKTGRLTRCVKSEAVGSNVIGSDAPRKIGSLCASEVLIPGETKEFVFYLGWYFPNRYGWWPDGHCREAEEKEHNKIWQNYYSTIWKSAKDVVEYVFKNEKELCHFSSLFSNALYSTTLDPDIIESLVSSITVLRSNTCFRISNGHFFGWEGCFEHAGSCAGTCTHVWNYAQTMAFLFPDLERSARRIEFLEETDSTGNMAFRAKRLLDGKKWDMLPATDGQLGSILRVYREWKFSGDDNFLREIWDKVVLALEHSIEIWDQDKDGVLEAQQHNTYDIEFYGINSLTNSIFYATLEAASQMAQYLGDAQKAKTWHELFLHGRSKMDALLWNGSYYEQLLSEKIDTYKYQHGMGCLSDQLLGQELAHLYGIGYILPEEHARRAVYEIYKNNYCKSLEKHESVQRTYAYPDEGGLVLCSWPKGGRPKQPFVYSDEVWSGIEYQVAVHLIYEGYIDEAMEIVHTIRKRHDGTRRSPYNENECGNHYARSMAAWGLLVALSGFRFDLCKDNIEFHPKTNVEKFLCFYSTGKEWGIYKEGEIIPFYKKKLS